MIKKIVITLFSVTTLFVGSQLAGSSVVQAAPCTEGAGALSTTIFVPWYKYLECTNGSPDIEAVGGWEKAIPLIAIAIIELLTRLAGLIAVGFIIWGGIQYTISQGEPEGINNAKSTILNAIVGLVIVVIAIGLVQFVAGLIR